LAHERGGAVLDAAAFAGSDCGEKINHAVEAAGSAAVTVQVGQSCGTSRWSSVDLHFGQNLDFVQGGVYNVGAIRLYGNNRITGTGMSTVTLVATAGTQSCILCVMGTPAREVFYVEVRDVGFHNTFATAGQAGVAGSSAIRLVHSHLAYLEHVRILDFDEGVHVEDSTYTYLENSYLNGSFTAQYSERCCGPFYLMHDLLNGSPTGAGVLLVNSSSGKIDHNDIVRNRRAGIVLTQDSGQSIDMEITNNTIDSDGDYGIKMTHVSDSRITGNWISAGRTDDVGCLFLAEGSSVTVAQNTLYWCGNDGMDLSASSSLSVSENTVGATYGIGINVGPTAPVVHSTFTANSCSASLHNGAGYPKPSWCIYEQGTSQKNVYVGNISDGMKSGDFHIGGESTNLNGKH
jgi:hypothetical protein